MKPARRIFLATLATAIAAAGLYSLSTTMTSTSEPVDVSALLRSLVATDAPPLRLTPSHVALMRHLRVMWVPIEDGAPGIDGMKPIAGPGTTIANAMAALDSGDTAFATRTLAELALLVDVFVREGKLAPGRYAIPAEHRAYFEFPDSGVDAAGNFELRKEHLVLLRGAQWNTVNEYNVDDAYNEDADFWPLPYIDGKRPYGDRSYYVIDMAELLGEPYGVDAQGEHVADTEKDARFERLHLETTAALQVFLLYATLGGAGN